MPSQLTVAATGVPIVGDVAAGQPILAVENITGSLDLTTAFGEAEVFAVRVKGDSMINCGIQPPSDTVRVGLRTDPVAASALEILISTCCCRQKHAFFLSTRRVPHRTATDPAL